MAFSKFSSFRWYYTLNICSTNILIMVMHEYIRKSLTIDCEAVTNYIVERIREYLEFSNKKGGVIGVSGGVDSAVTATLLAKATDNFFILLMPSSSTPKIDLDDSFEMIKFLNAQNKYKLINIDEIVKSFSNKIETENKYIIGNIKARVRMIILYAYAQMLDYLVVGTGDKSELLLGYFTKYGDGGVDVLPIGDLYKTQVRMLGKCLGLPERIVTKPSSPALWEGQTAEGELGIDYETIDSILYLRFDEMRSEDEIVKMLGIPIDIVKKVDRLVKISQHKRLPPEIFRLSGRAINSDWRFPRRWA
ncbi:NAD+ synthase [Saccharolobus solfataricus]|nr:NAD+ synthase [Saccharolobus solfataricus]AAK42347.1 NH(3+) dependent NAD(+) synthetase (nadE) [Saccharolobus solfataricus P2]AKA74962.1 NAD+ synthase [Saccharolobus solfataricus]AKA77658.1 NAD+ synthase [Saccharolobus solfataricus]AKA80349.1 NAD+ synthase [Saccharolobus solfataricus]AZF69427.1 NAD+ synthase [Saccharolobus solfataricus]